MDVAERPHLGDGRRAGGGRAHDGEARPARPRGQALSGRRRGRHPRSDSPEVRARGLALLLDGASVGRRYSRSGGNAAGAGARVVRCVQRTDPARQVRRLQDVSVAYRFLDVRRNGAVERLTLNRPDVRNAFNEEVIAELTAWANATAQDSSLRVVIVAGAGKVFSAGADANWM